MMGEKRVFYPPKELSQKAYIKSMNQYREIYQRSIEDPKGFWAEAAEQLDWYQKWDKVLVEDFKEAKHEWFVGGKLNVSHNCLDRHLSTWRKNKAAIIWEGDVGDTRVLTYQQLHREVCRFSNVLKKARIRKISAKWRLVPWAVLAAIVLLSAATFEPIYCSWLCPFKTVTEYPEVRSLETAVQAGIFLSLFAGLVVTLPILTRKRTQCAYFCPFGAFQSLFNKVNVFDIRIDPAKCADCVSCQRSCPIQALDQRSVERGKTLMACMRCGACVDVCHKQAAFWHIKGTEVGVSSERARLMYLYAAWAFATMFGGSILANSLRKMLGFLG